MVGLPKILNGISRQIKVHSNNIQILKTPTDFQNSLLSLSSEVKHRSRISSLYIGSGNAEQEIVGNLVDAARQKNCDVGVVLDRYRAVRQGAPILMDLRKCARVHLYQTPHLRLAKYHRPGVLGEVLGVHHMKYYLFDDNVIVSGANMSELYFGPRQDRYFLIKSKQLADYISYAHDMHVKNAKVWDISSYTVSHWNAETLKLGRRTSQTLCCNTPIENNETRDLGPANGDTMIYPLFQLPWDSAFQLDDALEVILGTAKSNQSITMSSGYFNPTFRLRDNLRHSKAQIDIIIPSVKANGFYKGAFVKGYVPDLYNLSAVRTLKKCPNVNIVEYNRDGWSYHAKGVWSDNMTILGSSNFNKRSSVRDTEFSVAMVTANEELRDALLEEKDRLMFYADAFRKHYRSIVPLGMPFVSTFL